MNDNLIYLLHLPDVYLLYAPLHDVAALVNKPALFALRDKKPRKLPSDVEEIRQIISRKPDSYPRQRQGEFVPDFIGLVPTRDCNLACSYCGFRSQGKALKVMEPELAMGCIDWYARLLKKAKKEILNLHFFGGEPLIASRLVMMAVHAARIKSSEHKLQAKFEVATNGIMNEATAKFVSEFIDFIMLSIDGPPDIHNIYRPTPNGDQSFEDVYRSAKIFSEGSGNLYLRACITSETVGRMEEISDWFYQEFRPSSVCFETLQTSPESLEAGLNPPDPWDFALNFVKSASVLEGFGVENVYATADIEARRISFCPVSGDVIIVSPNSNVAGCYLLERDWEARGLDLNLGKVSATGKPLLDEETVKRLRAMNVLNIPRCQKCFCKWHCAGGCHVNHSYPGCGDTYDDLCIQTRVITLYNILKSLGRKDVFERLVRDKNAFRQVILQSSDVFDDLELRND
jgi:uncharacterized protein